MNPETREVRAWAALNARAAAQISPGFAGRVVREARARALREPSLAGQLMLGAVTAALCFLAIAIFDARASRAAGANNLADWQQIASASEELAQAE
jgi:hypothetical protein